MPVIRCVRAEAAEELLSAMEQRREKTKKDVRETVAVILADVRENGFAAVCAHSVRLDGAAPRELSKKELQDAYDACDPALIKALALAAENIRKYHENMLVSSWQWRRADGALAGQVVRGLSRVGLYVPGGTAAYPSSVLMAGIPAKVAGVKELVMATPPGENLKKSVLAAAFIAGVDRVVAVGGAQAVAAMAYGAGFIPKVDKIVGPGNAYVAEAKRQVYGACDIDIVAGPSEILIIADETADPAYVAADLLSQAEHDVLAGAWLLTDSAKLAERVPAELENILRLLPRAKIAKQSLADFGAVILCDTLDECAALANRMAPEHVSVMTKEPRALLPLIENAGAIFLGPYSPEPLGDYMAGPSHVLPTSGTARFSSPLSTDSFLKKTSVIEYEKDALRALAEPIALLSAHEGLDAHGYSVKRRFFDENS